MALSTAMRPWPLGGEGGLCVEVRALDLAAMAKFRISRRADADLGAIWDHIARDSIEAADKVELEIHSEIKRLAEMPGMGHEREDVGNPAYRFWRVYSYLVAYRMEGRTLIVVRVVHGARDLRRIFKPLKRRRKRR
jgi:toxin ParE1/3/4